MEVPSEPSDGAIGSKNAHLQAALAGLVIEHEIRPGRARILPLPRVSLGKRHNVTIAIAPTSSSGLTRERLAHLGAHRSRAEMVWGSEFVAASPFGAPPDGLGPHARRRQQGAVRVAVIALGGPVSTFRVCGIAPTSQRSYLTLKVSSATL